MVIGKELALATQNIVRYPLRLTYSHMLLCVADALEYKHLQMLCNKCNSIDWDQVRAKPLQNPGYSHHLSFADLVTSAANGCKLCRLIEDKQYFRVISDSGLFIDSPFYIQARDSS